MTHRWKIVFFLLLGGVTITAGSVVGAPTSKAAFDPLAAFGTSQKPPDPLVSRRGKWINTPKDWFSVRRPELVRLMTDTVYGRTPNQTGIIVKQHKGPVPVMGGKATYKELLIHFRALKQHKGKAPFIRVALITPRTQKKKHPVFVALNKCGNQSVIPDNVVSFDASAWVHPRCRSKGWIRRGDRQPFWNVDYLIKRGYGFATYHESNIDPDKNDFSDGIHPHFQLKGDKKKHWATLAAWAWGLQRVVDALYQEAHVDHRRISLIGHSRRGKAALLAAAMDPRVALVVPHQSGTGGMALSRQNNQETIQAINTRFPHWFNGVFKMFHGREAKLPVDQHFMIALMAPRPLLATEGIKDTWANYISGVQTLALGSPVYRLLGVPGLVGRGVLQKKQLINSCNTGSLLQYRLDTVHTLNRDYWKVILDFADLQLTEQKIRQRRKIMGLP